MTCLIRAACLGLLFGSIASGMEVTQVAAVASEIAGFNLDVVKREFVREYLSYVADLQDVYDHPGRLTNAMVLKAVQERQLGGIQALAHVRKDDQSVTFISCSGLTGSVWYTPCIFGEELAKSLILPYIPVWEFATEPTVLLLFTPHRQGYAYDSEFNILKGWAQTFFSGFVPAQETPTLDMVVHTIAERYFKQNGEYRCGKLQIEFLNTAMQLLSGKKGHAAPPSGMLEVVSRINALGLRLSFMGCFRDAQKLQELVLHKKELEECVSLSLGETKTLSLGAYAVLFNDYKKNVKSCLLYTDHVVLKKHFLRVCEDLERFSEDMLQSFSLQGPEWKSITMERFLLNLIRSSGTPRDLAAQLMKMTSFIFIEGKLSCNELLVDLLSRYKHIVILGREASESALDFLGELGFTGQMHGVIAHPEEEVKHDLSPFTARDIVWFLDRVSKTIQPDYSCVTDPRYTGMNPFIFFAEDPFLVDAIRDESVRELTLGKTTRYINRNTGAVSEEPFFDTALRECLSCGTSFTGAMGVAKYTEGGTLCSYQCLARSCCKSIKPLTILLEAEALSAQERKTLRAFGALCGLYYLTLVPTARSTTGAFYQVRHERIKELLSVLAKQGSSDPSWAAALEYARQLGIDVPALGMFTGIYGYLKKQYHADLLAYARTKKYRELSTECAPDFDPRGHVSKYHKNQYIKLCAHGKFSDRTSLEVCPQLFREILALISQKVGFSFKNLEQLLTFELTEVNEQESTRKPLPVAKKRARVKPTTKSVKLIETAELFEIDAEEHLEEEAQESVLHTAENVPVKSSAQQPLFKQWDFECLFALRVPYSVRLYKPDLIAFERAREGRSLWNGNRKVRNSYRVETMLALAQEIEGEVPIERTKEGNYCLSCRNLDYDDSITSRLDLHHLFPRKLDTIIRTCGIPEVIDESLLQVSMPGTIQYEDGTFENGFFQLSYTPGTWICIHRCFKVCRKGESKYISSILRDLLQRILTK